MKMQPAEEEMISIFVSDQRHRIKKELLQGSKTTQLK